MRIQIVVMLGFLLLSAGSPSVSNGQRHYGSVKVGRVTSQSTSTGTMVTISADGPLGRAQTWQDEEGYHVVLPDTISAESLKPVRGVKVTAVGSSLEILIQTKPGARVSAYRGPNQLNLVVDGKLQGRQSESRFSTQPPSFEERRLFEDPSLPQTNSQSSVGTSSATASPQSSQSATGENENGQSGSAVSSESQASQVPSSTSSNQIVPLGDGTTAPQVPLPEIEVQRDDESLLGSIFSGTSVLIVLLLGLIGIVVSRRVRSRTQVRAEDGDTGEKDSEPAEPITGTGPARVAHAGTNGRGLARVGQSIPAKSPSGHTSMAPAAGPTSLYGAYRIDQEVGKLVFGQPHRIDVLASRAIDDRRAVESSLIKSVNSPELDESAQRRAREALEEYGFVARQCATLLLAPDTFERTSAARLLGEIRSPAALPFLLESLYDSEPIVRNQAVVSIGQLKLPSAIGALLDVARTHPDVPTALLSRTLSACSVEGLDFFDAVIPDASLLESGDVGHTIQEITRLEPAAAIEPLPEECEDERLEQALSSLESIDVGERSEALKTLAQFQVQGAVEAIARVARHDSEPNIRALAISSLGLINHESVFPTVVIGMADDSREVRAAAARSLSRLNLDRADAYVRVLESSDEETIRNVAKACVLSGIVSQNLDRLVDCDHRQAYETFSLICLLSKARMNEPILEAISDHPRIDVRLRAVHLLASTGHPEVIDQLRDLTLRDGMRENVKTALLEAIYTLDKGKSLNQTETADEAAGTFFYSAESQLENAEAEIVASVFGADIQPEVNSDSPAECWTDGQAELSSPFQPLLETEIQPVADERES